MFVVRRFIANEQLVLTSFFPKMNLTSLRSLSNNEVVPLANEVIIKASSAQAKVLNIDGFP